VVASPLQLETIVTIAFRLFNAKNRDVEFRVKLIARNDIVNELIIDFTLRAFTCGPICCRFNLLFFHD
jgi:hypothetical protein